MRIDEVKRVVEKIARVARGEESTPVKNEYAKLLEADLYVNVLRAIADGVENPESLARAALETQLIPFERTRE